MFSLLGKGRPLTGALLFRVRKGGGVRGGWFGGVGIACGGGGVRDCVRGMGCKGGICRGRGPQGRPPQAGARGGRRPPRGSGRRPERPAGPSSAGICGKGKAMGLQIGGGGGAEGAAAGRPRLRPQAGPSGGRSRRAQPVGFGAAETACARHFPPLARRPRCGTIGAEPKESEEQPHEKDSEL